MKLDRNINPDGRGKYALINLRRNTVEWGGPDGQFFVIKYKDKFASRALSGYADAVTQEILRLQSQLAQTNNRDIRPEIEKEIASLQEYEAEIRQEAIAAEKAGHVIPT